MGRRILSEKEKKQKVVFRLSPEAKKNLQTIITRTDHTKTQIFEQALKLYDVFTDLETRADPLVRSALRELDKIKTIEDSPSLILSFQRLVEKVRAMADDMRSIQTHVESASRRQSVYPIIFSLTISSVMLSGLHRGLMQPFWDAMQYEEERAELWEKREMIKMELGLKSELTEGWQPGKMKLQRSTSDSMDFPTKRELEDDIKRLEALKAKRKEVKQD